MYLAMGTEEYSKIRPKDPQPEFDARLAGYIPLLAQHLEEAGVGETRLRWEVEVGATHTEAAWAARLPRALAFLLSDWWRPILAAKSGNLYFTVPKQLRAGQVWPRLPPLVGNVVRSIT